MGLYHYTDVAAVYSILKNRKLWLTDIRFLNDSKELRTGIDLLVEHLKSASPDVFANFEYLQRAESFLIHEMSDLTLFGACDDPLFVFSLSSDGDCLSQWRAYGSYAIEFDLSILEAEVAKVHKCLYGDTEKIISAKNHATAAISSVSNALLKYNGSFESHTFDALFELYQQAATYKDNGFAEENEYRIVVPSHDFDFRHEVKYRPKGGLLMPYLEVDISLDCIKSVTVGPLANQDLAFTSMYECVKSIERNWQMHHGDIEFEIRVEKSKIPYRSIS